VRLKEAASSTLKQASVASNYYVCTCIRELAYAEMQYVCRCSDEYRRQLNLYHWRMPTHHASNTQFVIVGHGVRTPLYHSIVPC